MNKIGDGMSEVGVVPDEQVAEVVPNEVPPGQVAEVVPNEVPPGQVVEVVPDEVPPGHYMTFQGVIRKSKPTKEEMVACIWKHFGNMSWIINELKCGEMWLRQQLRNHEDLMDVLDEARQVAPPLVRKKPDGSQYKLNEDDVIMALTRRKGFVAHAAADLNVSPKGLYKFMERYPEVKDVLDDIREYHLDNSENKLLELVDNGDLQAIMFHLRCQGKHRGWVERQEVTGKDGKDLVIEVTNFKTAGV